MRGAQATSLETPQEENVVSPGFEARKLAPQPAVAICVALSGGPDSLALLACAVRAGLTVHAIVVDHNLQPGSADTAARAADQAIALGATAEVVSVTVDGPGGMEAAARSTRYDALDRARAGRPVLLGHTMDDQAETVLLGLARGSGARSLAGMREWNDPWGRPLLGLRRTDTRGACAELGLDTFDDPHNHDPRFTRVRLRTEALPLLDDVLHGGVVPALARTASSLQDDNDALDALATAAYATVATTPRATNHLDARGRSDEGPANHLDPRGRSDEGARVTRGPATLGSQPDPTPTLDARTLATYPPAIRRRIIRLWLHDCGATDPTHPVITAVDALAADWHGQGGVAIGGDPRHRLEVVRTAGLLTLQRTPR
nr:tRNA lysidine(34) synthetase TilS [Gordonia amarae]